MGGKCFGRLGMIEDQTGCRQRDRSGGVSE